MRAMVLERPAPIERAPLRLADLLPPEPGSGEIRVRIAVCGVCRTDLHVAEGDLAIFLMLLRFFSLNMNADGSLPTARWREMWTALHEAGDIDRAWCHHRYARMRNFLTEKDLLVWEDEDFTVGVVDDAGRFVPGKAAKWCATSMPAR